MGADHAAGIPGLTNAQAAKNCFEARLSMLEHCVASNRMCKQHRCRMLVERPRPLVRRWQQFTRCSWGFQARSRACSYKLALDQACSRRISYFLGTSMTICPLSTPTHRYVCSSLHAGECGEEQDIGAAGVTGRRSLG